MRSRRTTVLASTAALAVAASALLIGPSANAAPAHCASGVGCAYQNTGFTGGYKGFQNSIANYGLYFWSGGIGGMNESASSVYNNGNQLPVKWYKNPNGGGQFFKLGVKGYDSNLHDAVGVPGGFQDSLSSSYFRK